jgi:hypothetical protein
VEAVSWAAHPLYETAPFFVHDVGVVILKEPGVTGLSSYGQLPAVDSLDQLMTRRGRQDTTYTAVGYGLQQINPVFVQIHGDFSLLLSNKRSTGGTCFGDSGGPNFSGDSNLVAGVTSFGLNGNSAGTGGYSGWITKTC